MSPTRQPTRRVNPAGQWVFLACLTGLAALAVVFADPSSHSLESELTITIGLSAAFFATRLLTIRLPQGDDVYVTLVVGLSALAVADATLVAIASLVAATVETIARYSQSSRRESVSRVNDAVRGAAVIALMAPWQASLDSLTHRGMFGEAAILWTLVVGMVYSGVDILTMAAQQRVSGGLPVVQGIATLQRPLGTMYLVHLAMAAVAVRLFDSLGSWAFPIALLLTLILQNSFNLYLRIRRGYAETIGALAHAAELDRPQDSGHARRVADLSVAVGRRMGLSSKELERIGYAALLHDIGRMGGSGDEISATHTQRGAEIVASIPFLADVAPLIYQADDVSSIDVPVGGAIVRTCSRYDRLRAEVGSGEALQQLAIEVGGLRGRVLETLDEVIRGQNAAASFER